MAQGFSAIIGASGSFQPKHLSVPVTVFFYDLVENNPDACPYMVIVDCILSTIHTDYLWLAGADTAGEQPVQSA